MLDEKTLSQILIDCGLSLDKYNVGRGGSAIVHKAKVIKKDGILDSANDYVAVKEYKDSITSVSGQIDRIKQESTIINKISHPGIVKIFGLLSSQEINERGIYLLAMDWIDGEPLNDWYAKNKETCDWNVVSKILMDIISSVKELHANNIFHRDIKPENIFIKNNKDTVLMDVGIAEITDSTEHTLHTILKDFIGSVRYASPQFINGEKYDEKDDIYSYGTVVFLLATGTEVFNDVERKPLIPYFVLTKNPKIEGIRDGIPANMKIFLYGCLHKERKRRPSIAEIEEYLKTPESSQYIEKEIKEKSKEARGYLVLSVDNDGNSLIADLRGENPDHNGAYYVVRRLQSIKVPSLNEQKIEPEKWLAEVSFKHEFNGVGHFVVQGKRWESDQSSTRGFNNLFGNSGQYVTYDKGVDRVKIGDIIIR